MIHRGYLLCLAAVLTLTPSLAQGQAPPLSPQASKTSKPAALTIFTAPENATATLRGPGDLAGRTPLEVPPLMTGSFSIIVEGNGLSRTQGVIHLPPAGGLPFMVSEQPGVSLGLILRGINFPGVPNMAGGRLPRGVPLLTGALGAGIMAVRAHLYYRDRLDEVGEFAADRAQEEKNQRNDWIIYSAALWGMSAVDYWIRPRFSLNETTPTRLTLGVPRATRGGAIWRSILIPGAGQEFGNHRTRSVVWLSTVILSGAGYVVADYRYDRDVTDLKWAQIGVDNATPAELPTREAQLAQAQRSLDESKDIRRGAVVIGAAFYALNVFDTMIMRLKLEPPEKPKVSSIAPIMLPDGPGVGVTLLF
jgi:uncharacterized protein DUF5683